MMVRKDIQQLLQECMEGYDAGLTPEECLSAYPRVRAELEPLFRQAISLRVAYAAAPRPEFRFQAREKLLFAAGRDVSRALSAEPSEEFVSTTRQRLLNRAGAGAQEALRDVPPPRLPFWANARRHLLETAAATPPKPAPRMPVGVRYALSAAVIVLAIGIAGGGFFLQNSPASSPTGSALNAELNDLTQRVATAEQMRASGQSVSSLLDDLSTQTSKLAEQYSADNPNADLISKLPDLIQRQQSLLSQEDPNAALASAQERLNQADQTLAAVNPATSPVPTETTGATAAIVETPQPTVEVTVEPTETPEVIVPDIEPIDSSALGAGQVVSQYNPARTDLNIRWWHVTTSSLSFDMPESWVITNMSTNDDGLAVLTPPDALFIKTDASGISLIVYNTTGKVDTLVDGQQYTLRPEGADSKPMDHNSLFQLVNLDTNGAGLYNMLDSITLAAPSETATTSATSTSTSTATPETTATATPDATLEATTTPGDQ